VQSAAADEVDLSDEWEAMVQEVAETAPPAAAAEPVSPPVEINEPESETIEIVEEPEVASVEAEAAPAESGATPAFEIVEEPAAEVLPAETIDPVLEPETVAAGSDEFELSLTPEPALTESDAVAATTQDLINQLVAELDDLEAPTPAAVMSAEPEETPPTHLPEVAVGSNGASASGEQSVHEESPSIPETTAENLNELAEVFQEFRSELGELAEEEEEDLETHYNLGIAYREMGLLDEAIGEFQKVAKAVQKGKPFPYAMNCSTLLALTFMDKGEPKIASLWYKRALEVPGLDPETVLALRYDLAVSLETAGESTAALDSFRQVYAMNIDYRDVADHIATLQKV
jgi:hypothetical protein